MQNKECVKSVWPYLTRLWELCAMDDFSTKIVLPVLLVTKFSPMTINSVRQVIERVSVQVQAAKIAFVVMDTLSEVFTVAHAMSRIKSAAFPAGGKLSER